MDEKDILEETDSGIIDLDGEPFVMVEKLDFEGVTYVALTPYDEDEEEDDDSDDSEEAEFIILKEVEEDGEFFLATIDDEELYDKIGEEFLKMFGGEGEYEED